MYIKSLIPQFIKDYYKYHVTDYYIISYPKAGRTWLRFLIGYYLNKYYKLNLPLDKITITRLFYNYNLPYINFSHFGNPHLIKCKMIKKINFTSLNKKKIIFMYRDPRPQSVSNYYQFFYRGDNKKISNYNSHKNIDEFVLGDLGGINSIINYYNLIYNYSKTKNIYFLKYEDLIKKTNETLNSLFLFLDIPIDSDLLSETIEMSTKKSLSDLESKGLLNKYHFGGTSDKNFKVRMNKKKWNDELKPSTIKIINNLLNELNPFYLKK